MEGSLSLGEEIVGAAEKQQRAMTEEDHAEGMKMMFSDSTEDGSCESSTSSEASSGKYTLGSGGSEDDSVEHSVALCWRVRKVQLSNETVGDLKPYPSDKFRRTASDVEMMKERLSKLLLGEDMSGCGKGVCAALAISNAITNLCATVFGQLWRLEPLTPEKRSMWRREMEWLVCVSDHIVELVPSWQTLPNGRRLEVMTCRPRSDLYINLPALRKLDNMLLEILDSFSGSEFWYVDQGILAPDSDGSASFRRTLLRQEEKWWLPVPRVPPAGLLESTRKQLEHKRECTKQILKAALEINSSALADMDVPTSYLNSLPKNGRASLGDPIYRHIFSDQFSSEGLLDSLELSSEHQALEVANRVEAAIYIWRKQITGKPAGNRNCATAKPSWSMVKDMIAVDAEKRESLADRAEVLLLCLKQRFPALTQTALDMSKIQFNKLQDVGKSILESYSRVLESLAFNIIARIDELICVDDLSKHSSEGLLDPSCRTLHKNAPMLSYLVPPSGTPSCSSAYGTPNFSPAQLVSPASGERSALINRNSHNRSGFTVKKAITNYLSTEGKKL